MYDLGDTVTLAAKVVNAAGNGANADNATATVTLPDGTPANPAVPNPPAQTGQYTATYVPVQAGLHRWRMTFTGSVPDQAYGDVFHAWPLVDIAFISLADTKKTLNISPTDISQDDELREAIKETCAVVEDIVGVVARRSFTQSLSGGLTPTLLLSYRPVISVQSVVVDGVTLDPSAYSVDAYGVLTRLNAWRGWALGANNVVVTSTAGRTIVADNIVGGARDLIRFNFRPQLGGNRSPYDRAAAQQQQGGGEMRLGFWVPNSVMERLQASRRGPHIA